jgi:hypothetical protein
MASTSRSTERRSSPVVSRGTRVVRSAISSTIPSPRRSPPRPGRPPAAASAPGPGRGWLDQPGGADGRQGLEAGVETVEVDQPAVDLVQHRPWEKAVSVLWPLMTTRSAPAATAQAGNGQPGERLGSAPGHRPRVSRTMMAATSRQTASSRPSSRRSLDRSASERRAVAAASGASPTGRTVVTAAPPSTTVPAPPVKPSGRSRAASWGTGWRCRTAHRGAGSGFALGPAPDPLERGVAGGADPGGGHHRRADHADLLHLVGTAPGAGQAGVVTAGGSRRRCRGFHRCHGRSSSAGRSRAMPASSSTGPTRSR